MPSRRFYAAKTADFEELRKTVKRKKLSLKRKPVVGRYAESANESEDTDNRQLHKIEDMIKKVCS